MFTRLVATLACALGCLAASVHAATFVATDGSASADITAVPNGPNTNVTIVLHNLTTSTTSAGNLLTGIDFGPTNIAAFTLTSQTAPRQFTFASQTSGALDAPPPFNPTWALVSSPPFDALYFNGFGTGGKPIIGPAAADTTYAGANSSLTAGPHGTYIYQDATFTLLAPGVFDPNSLAGVNFRFNTDGLTVVPGEPGSGAGVPEPASIGLLAIGALALLRRSSR